jgi:hypothetical protein
MKATGTTTQQLKGAPQGALFIYNSDYLDYPKGLCKLIGREDVHVKGVHVLKDWHSLLGYEYSAIIVDHAVENTAERFEGFAKLLTKCVKDRQDSNFIDLAENLARECRIRPQDFK